MAIIYAHLTSEQAENFETEFSTGAFTKSVDVADSEIDLYRLNTSELDAEKIKLGLEKGQTLSQKLGAPSSLDKSDPITTSFWSLTDAVARQISEEFPDPNTLTVGLVLPEDEDKAQKIQNLVGEAPTNGEIEFKFTTKSLTDPSHRGILITFFQNVENARGTSGAKDYLNKQFGDLDHDIATQLGNLYDYAEKALNPHQLSLLLTKEYKIRKQNDTYADYVIPVGSDNTKLQDLFKPLLDANDQSSPTIYERNSGKLPWNRSDDYTTYEVYLDANAQGPEMQEALGEFRAGLLKVVYDYAQSRGRIRLFFPEKPENKDAIKALINEAIMSEYNLQSDPQTAQTIRMLLKGIDSHLDNLAYLNPTGQFSSSFTADGDKFIFEGKLVLTKSQVESNPKLKDILKTLNLNTDFAKNTHMAPGFEMQNGQVTEAKGIAVENLNFSSEDLNGEVVASLIDFVNTVETLSKAPCETGICPTTENYLSSQFPDRAVGLFLAELYNYASEILAPKNAPSLCQNTGIYTFPMMNNENQKNTAIQNLLKPLIEAGVYHSKTHLTRQEGSRLTLDLFVDPEINAPIHQAMLNFKKTIDDAAAAANTNTLNSPGAKAVEYLKSNYQNTGGADLVLIELYITASQLAGKNLTVVSYKTVEGGRPFLKPTDDEIGSFNLDKNQTLGVGTMQVSNASGLTESQVIVNYTKKEVTEIKSDGTRKVYDKNHLPAYVYWDDQPRFTSLEENVDCVEREEESLIDEDSDSDSEDWYKQTSDTTENSGSPPATSGASSSENSAGGDKPDDAEEDITPQAP